MNYAGLVDFISGDTGLSKKDVKTVIDKLADSVSETLKGGGTVFVAGLGRFSAKRLGRRIMRHPKTQQPMVASAKFRPHFTASGEFKKSVQRL